MRKRESKELGEQLRECWARVGGSSFIQRPGATEEEITDFERRYEAILPPDLRAYLTLANGMDPNASDDFVTSFWGLDRMKPIAEVYSVVSSHPDSRFDFVICDILIDSFWYAVRLAPGAWGQVAMWGVRDFPVPVARSFTDFAEAYLADRHSLASGLATIGLPETCPLHHAQMEERPVGPRYGDLLTEPPSVYEAAVRHFPFSGVGPWGGDRAPTSVQTWPEPVCVRCARARQDWITVHRRSPPTRTST